MKCFAQRPATLLVSRDPNNRIPSARAVQAMLEAGSTWISKYRDWQKFVQEHAAALQQFFSLDIARSLIVYGDALNTGKKSKAVS